VPAAGFHGGGSSEFSRKCDSGLSLGSGLAWEQEGDVRNTSTGLRRSVGDRGRQATARHGRIAPASHRARGKAGGRGNSGWRGSSPQCEASGVLAQRRGAAERRRGERHKYGGNGSGGMTWVLRVSAKVAPVTLGKELGHGGA
jgi:hypothetical protein